MEDFLSMYGPFILLGIFLIYLIGINVYRTKKYTQQAKNLIASLKKGDYVKTYGGFYGSIVSIEEKPLNSGQAEKMIKLDVGENSFITIDANAVYALVNELKTVTPAKRPVKKPTKKITAKTSTKADDTTEEE